MKSKVSGTENGTDLELRDARALTECITVMDSIGRARDADELYIVVSESGSEYLVDLRDGVCSCPDHTHRDVRCKHLRAVEFATGRRPIPEWVDVDAINNTLGAHVEEDPVFGQPEPEPATVTVGDGKPARQVATDGGREIDLREEFDDSVRSEASMMECPDCGAGIPSRHQTDFESKTRWEFPSELGGCGECGFDGTVYSRFNADMERVEEQVIRQQDQQAATDGGQVLEEGMSAAERADHLLENDPFESEDEALDVDVDPLEVFC